MLQRTHGVLLLAATSFGTLLGAQTFVVDAAGGAGSNFTDLPAAIAAVPDGAVLLVRQGQYSSFTIQGKSLTILGDIPDAYTTGPIIGTFSTVNSTVITVSSLAANQHVVLRGIRTGINFWQSILTVQIQNCQGSVLLDKVKGLGLGASTQIDIDQCSQVMLANCRFEGVVNNYALNITNSDVVIVDSTFRPNPSNGDPALLQTGGHLQLTGTTVTGGAGMVGASSGAAIVMTGGELRCDGGTWIAGGQANPLNVSLDGQAIIGTGNVRLDPSVVLSGRAPLIAPAITATTVDLASVNVVGGVGWPNWTGDGELGGTAQATMQGASTQFGVLFLGLPSAPFSLPPGDAVWVSGGVVLDYGMLTSPLIASVSVPNVASLAGASLGWQGFTFDTNGAFGVTNPAWFVVH